MTIKIHAMKSEPTLNLPEPVTEVTPELVEAWSDVKVVAVDIETDTVGDPKNPASKLGKYGLSYNADILDVGLHAEGAPPIAFDMRVNPENKIQFVKEVLSRNGIVIVGHNVVFDLRQLGGHYDFTIARYTHVWDTMTISVRLMLGDPMGRGFGLENLILKFKLIQPNSSLSNFVAFMKLHRAGGVSQIVETLSTLPMSDHLWDFLGGYVPPTETEALNSLALTMMSQYVYSDALFSYRLYQFHCEIVDRLEYDHVRVTDEILIHQWKGVGELTTWQLRGLRVAANQSIRGIDFDVEYVNKMVDQHQQIVDSVSDSIFETPDPTDPYPDFKAVFSKLLYYSMVLDVCRNPKNTLSKVKGWVNWLDTSLSIQIICGALDHSEPELVAEWAQFLHNLVPGASRKDVLSNCPETEYVPKIDLGAYVQRICFEHIENDAVSKYLAHLKVSWWAHYYKLTASKMLPVEKLINKSLWKPYYVFVLSEVPLPSVEDIKNLPELTVDRVASLIEHATDDDCLSTVIQARAFSFGKTAIDYYISTNDTLKKYHAFLESTAKISRLSEWKLHSLRDGKVHSVVIPSTRTGRGSSTNPNLQNISMPGFRGVFVAPEGFVFTEWDYANAENKTAAMVAIDNAMSWATETGDFHSNMAKKYRPEQWAAASKAERKVLRNLLKAVTFGTAYGMGVIKLSRVLKISIEEARKILDSKDQAFPAIRAKKKALENNCLSRAKQGFSPPWVSLWSGDRVAVQTFSDGEIPAYTTWNYVQQGSVAVMTSRSRIETAEQLEDEQWESYVALDIHDSLIAAQRKTEYPAMGIKISKIMGGQVPVEFCCRTSPPVHFVTEAGPENAFKWGWRDGQDYPLPLDEFVNQWGCHKLSDDILELPVGEREAPTWIGAEHEGYTLEREIVEIENERRGEEDLDDDGEGGAITMPVVTEHKKHWDDLCKYILQTRDIFFSHQPHIAHLLSPRVVSFVAPTGEVKKTDPVMLPQRAALSQILYHKGHSAPLQQDANQVEETLDSLLEMSKQLEKVIDQMLISSKGYFNGFSGISYAEKSPDSDLSGESTGHEERPTNGYFSARETLSWQREEGLGLFGQSSYWGYPPIL